MTTIVWMTLGFSAVSGVMLMSDWVRVHRPSRFFTGGHQGATVSSAPAWALEELKFVRATERLPQVGAAVMSPSCSGTDLSHLHAAA